MSKSKMESKGTASKSKANTKAPSTTASTKAEKPSAKAEKTTDTKASKAKPAVEQKAEAKASKAKETTPKAETPKAGDFVRVTYTKGDVASEYATLTGCKASVALEQVDFFMQAVLNVANRIKVGINEKGKPDSDILQLTGLLSIDASYHKETTAWNAQTKKKHKVPAKFHTRISAGSALKGTVDDNSNAMLAKLNKKKAK